MENNSVQTPQEQAISSYTPEQAQATYAPDQTGGAYQQAYAQAPQTQQGYVQNPAVQQGTYQQPVYVQNNYYQTPPPNAPVRALHHKRSTLKFIVFTFLTLGIYPLLYFTSISDCINIAASRYDGRKTMHACLMFLIVSPLTMGIGALVWYHNMSDRVGNEARRRQVYNSFSAVDFWLWFFLGSLIFIGPFVYIYKLSKAMNAICEHYNMYG